MRRKRVRSHGKLPSQLTSRNPVSVLLDQQPEQSETGGLAKSSESKDGTGIFHNSGSIE